MSEPKDAAARFEERAKAAGLEIAVRRMRESTRTAEAAAQAVPEEAASGTGVRVVVVRDVAHVVVDVVLELEVLGDDRREDRMHVLTLGLWWRDAVLAPDDHRHGTDILPAFPPRSCR